ncbi:MAG: cytochrome b/b6 domain-containing protein [Anaerolineales bacterium]
MTKERHYQRFTLSDRIEHWTQMAAFATLAITGLIQKFAEARISQTIVGLLGGIETTRIIHRSATVVLMLGVIYHIGTAGYKLFVLKSRPRMLPTLKDITNAWEIFLFNLGLKEGKPQQGRFTFDEKFEYWAFVWGTLVMGLSGFILWNPLAASRFLPGEIIPAAKAAHGGEALLAVLAIIVWHFYNVHIKHLNKSMFTGKLSEEEMLEEHPLELADIKAGLTKVTLSEEEIDQRKRVFFPVYGVVAAVMLVGVYLFIGIEDTAAITTVPDPEQAAVYVPLTPTPFPTPQPTATAPETEELAATWNGGVGTLFQENCSQCHGEMALGGLNVLSLNSLLEGGNSGQVIIPGDADNSPLVILQSAGGHPGQFSGESLALIKEWITNNTPED